MIKRPELKSVLALAKDYSDNSIVWVGLYDDGAWSIGTDFPDEARIATSTLIGRDTRKSIRKALDELDKMKKEAGTRKASKEIEDDTDQ